MPNPEKSRLKDHPDANLDVSSSVPAASDIPVDSWIDHLMPPWVRPYLRLARWDRPIGIWLLLAPCWWGVAFASAAEIPLDILSYLACGAVVMRGAGCTINDILDRDIDARVVRTAGRPLACGRIGLVGAWIFLMAQLLLGLVIVSRLNDFTILLALAVMPLVFLYPLAKRYTDWPQMVLGLTFNWGVLVGWAAVHGSLSMEPFLLYLAAAFWTLGYDTIYAHQDKADDLRVGVRSAALRLGSASRIAVAVFYALMVGLLILCADRAGLAWPFFAVLLFAIGHLVWQVARVDFADPANCLMIFRSNGVVGLIIFVAFWVASEGAG